jgi:hypothetical protein
MFEKITQKTKTVFDKPESTQPLPGADLPAWKCHKIVHAAKIVSIEYVAPRDDSAFAEHTLYLDFGIEGDITPVIVDPEWFAKHSPDEGGYLVVYEDGYQSYSPAEPFEAGYTLLEKAIIAEANAKCGCDNQPNSLTAPLAEAESILAWLKTQPSTPENKALRAQAGIVVDYLKAA